jgi:hypothetical protein
VNLFTAELANFLVYRLQPHWYNNSEANNNKVRQIDIKRLGANNTDSLFACAASAVGLEAEEVLRQLPSTPLFYNLLFKLVFGFFNLHCPLTNVI